jgi:Asp-tRNA(Asn)/Glu-tRNA(Gln) amidotransferase B subunit
MAKRNNKVKVETVLETVDTAPAETVISDADLDVVVAQILAQDEVSEAPAEEVSASEAVQIVDERQFSEIMDSITDEDADKYMTSLVGALEDRMSFEKLKDVTNDNILKTIGGARKSLAVSRNYPRVLIACNTTAEFANTSLHAGSRYNVYAIGKLADIVKGLAGGTVTNKINRACIASMIAVTKAGEKFDMQAAKAAASDKVREIEPKIATLMRGLRHTVDKGTAPTQASSTMQALQTLGIVVASGSKKNPEYAFTNTPASVKLQELFSVAA